MSLEKMDEEKVKFYFDNYYGSARGNFKYIDHLTYGDKVIILYEQEISGTLHTEVTYLKIDHVDYFYINENENERRRAKEAKEDITRQEEEVKQGKIAARLV